MERIREVDRKDEGLAATLSDLPRGTFFKRAPLSAFDEGHCWLALRERVPVAFGGLVQSTYAANAGYFCRVAVLPKHWGRALQRRLMRAAERPSPHQWLGPDHIRYDRQRALRQQLYSGGLSALVATLSLGLSFGMAAHDVLAPAHRMRRCK